MNRRKNKTLKIILRILIIVLSIIMAAGWLLHYCPVLYKTRIEMQDEEYYSNEELSYLSYAGSYQDRKTAMQIIQKADIAFSDFHHTEDENIKLYGKLWVYAHDSSEYNFKGESHTIKLLSAHFADKTGHMWILYSQSAYYEDNDSDSNGNVNSYNDEGCGICESFWTLQKDENGEWTVVDIHEHP